MISIGSVAQNRNDIAPLKGDVPINSTWDQYIPIVDDTGARLDLTDYDFELAFRRCESDDSSVRLRLSTVTGEIQKTTDTYGDTLRVFAAPSVMSGMCGNFVCSFAAKNIDDQIWLLARGIVTFRSEPAAFA